MTHEKIEHVDPQANADFDRINATKRYVMYSVFRRTDLPRDVEEATHLAQKLSLIHI